jgi:hypothetical protein
MKIPYQIRIDQDLLEKVKKSAKDNYSGCYKNNYLKTCIVLF